MNTRAKALVAGFLFVLSTAGFGSTQGRQLQELTTINALSGDFLSSKLQDNGLTNTLVSSVSLYYALSILERGAAGDSAALLEAFLLKTAESEVKDVAPALAEVLVLPENAHRAGTGMFQLANSVWSTDGASDGQPFVFAGPFKADAERYYDASVRSLDFRAVGASTSLNEWVDEKTNGLIPEIIDDFLLAKLEWVILNAAYFEGAWSTPMRAVPASDEYWFRKLDGARQQAETIKTRNYEARVLERDDGSVAFSLPFVGGKYTFIVHAPGKDEADVERWLLGTAVRDMQDVVGEVFANRSEVYRLSVQLPKFTFGDSVTLVDTSKLTHELGLAPLFSPKADFSLLYDAEKTPFDKRDTRVGIIKQDTRIELDENGVKAAAVTLVGGVVKATIARQPLPFREIVVDRPFVFAIVENRSQTMLFQGVLVEPE